MIFVDMGIDRHGRTVHHKLRQGEESVKFFSTPKERARRRVIREARRAVRVARNLEQEAADACDALLPVAGQIPPPRQEEPGRVSDWAICQQALVSARANTAARERVLELLQSADPRG